MENAFRNMLGRLDGEDEDSNFLGYDFFRECSILLENEDEMNVEK